MASRILLVDNDEDVSSVLRTALTKGAGFDVLQAFDGDQALARFRDERHGGRAIDLVVLDLRMPGRDGLEVLAELETVPDAPPVIVLSGYVDAADRSRLAESRLVHATFAKPFDIFELIAGIEEAIAARTWRGAASEDGAPFAPFFESSGD